MAGSITRVPLSCWGWSVQQRCVWHNKGVSVWGCGSPAVSDLHLTAEIWRRQWLDSCQLPHGCVWFVEQLWVQQQ